jgi:hypothetical protein
MIFFMGQRKKYEAKTIARRLGLSGERLIHEQHERGHDRTSSPVCGRVQLLKFHSLPFYERKCSDMYSGST